VYCVQRRFRPLGLDASEAQDAFVSLGNLRLQASPERQPDGLVDPDELDIFLVAAATLGWPRGEDG
jgi:hypothetical protein